VDAQVHILDALLFDQKSTKIDVVYAYGACGWFAGREKGAPSVAAGLPGSYARYCDLFALQDIAGKRYVTKKGDQYHGHVDVAWREPVIRLANATGGSLCQSADMQLQRCVVVHGEPVIPVMSAFGGMAVFRASLFRDSSASGGADRLPIHSTGNNSVNTSGGATTPCAYGTDQAGDECEHVPLSQCLHARGHKQMLALQLVVNWEREACTAQVQDTPPGESQRMWSNCPCVFW
jgi:hypothetical protein